MHFLREQILQEHSKAQTLAIAEWIGKDEERFRALLHLFLHDEYRVVQRAAWVLSYIAERHREMVAPYLPLLVKRMTVEDLPVAVKRNVLRMLQHMDIPESLHGEVMNMCFHFLEDVKETVAVRAFSMTVLARLAIIYPDIKQELKTVIEDALELEKKVRAGFTSRARRTLKELAIE